uniref:Transmembrane protein 120 homolog n=1 Tax=Strigamia maritima TaxID=126957 RepID=T1J6E3_STRMM
MDNPTINGCVEDWEGLSAEFQQLEVKHKQYIKKLEELQSIQNSCLKEISHQNYRMKQIKASLKKTKTIDSKKQFGKNLTVEDRENVHKLEKEMNDRSEQIRDLEQTLPRSNGFYLKIILGNVGVSLMNNQDKFRYKDEFEKFKLIVTAIGVVWSFINLTLVNYRAMDSAFMFLLVWYYCTLTIRESILKVNGSRIKGWWRAHHFISTVVSAILLIWPDTPIYHMFRKQFMVFNLYIGLLQYLQFRYQQGCLYRLKALGERHNMDITIEGFHSWMWKGLSFLLPFLYLGYLFQLYNAYVLYHLAHHELCTEWQVPVLSVSFLVLFLGNIITTSSVIPQKLTEKLVLKYHHYGKNNKCANNGKSSKEVLATDDNLTDFSIGQNTSPNVSPNTITDKKEK